MCPSWAIGAFALAVSLCVAKFVMVAHLLFVYEVLVFLLHAHQVTNQGEE